MVKHWTTDYFEIEKKNYFEIINEKIFRNRPTKVKLLNQVIGLHPKPEISMNKKYCQKYFFNLRIIIFMFGPI